MKHIFLAACILCFSHSIGNAQQTKSKEQKKETEQSIQLNKQNLHIKVKEEAKPDIYIDGKKYDNEILDLIDSDKIESMEVIKDKKALKEYDAPHGVILITSKKKTEVVVDPDKPQIMIKGTQSFEDAAPMIIIDGKKSNKKELEKLSPDTIESIEVLKDEKAMEKYNSKTGVIIVTSKKGEKNKK